MLLVLSGKRLFLMFLLPLLLRLIVFSLVLSINANGGSATLHHTARSVAAGDGCRCLTFDVLAVV